MAGVVLAIAPLLFVGVRFGVLGEYDIFDTAESLTAEHLHGPLSEDFAEYKLRMTATIRPNLLILGSSRVMQIRDFFFNRCSSRDCFYNAGGAATTIRTAADFLQEVAPSDAPRVLLLGLDIWQFDPNDPTNTHESVSLAPAFGERLRRAVGVVRGLTPRLESDSELRSVVAEPIAVPAGYRGIRAILRGEGFRPDGSYSYGEPFMSNVVRQSPDERSADAVARIAKSCCRMDRFTRSDERSLEELSRLVADAGRRGTEVVAFTLPFSDEVMDAVAHDSELRAGFDDVRMRLSDVLGRAGVPFFPYARLSDVGCSPSEMLDGFHPGEVCAARIVDGILASGEVMRSLAPYVDRSRLAALVAARSSDLVLPAP